ncbi:MAG TPA: nitroreductase family protein, partial [Gemmatimonadetes bacterium]|nr:nitroreductase family protein [Gemmatimonadota bacterium]
MSSYVELPVDEMRERARAFLKQAQDRRTVRDFSDRPIPRDIIETCIL